jgi:serine/threonine-protein kinase
MSDDLDRLKAALADRYAIEREVGRGGMATVYLAVDLKHHRKVAVKVLRPDLAATLGVERFNREITIAAALTHPHILTLHDSGEADGFLYYIMPYVEGPTLRHRLVREGELPVAEAVRILRDVADAVAAAHAQGVVHRDLKPENVMLSGRHALVVDFGVAKAVSEATGRHELTTKGVALGTPAYMAPEQAAADPLTDHRADLYALGVMAYEMLTGEPPFVRATPQAVLAAQVTEAPAQVTERRDTVPPALAGLVMRCLAKKPADRPQRAEEVLGVLEALSTPSGGMTPTATQPIRKAELYRSGLGRRTAFAAAGVITALLGVLLWPRSQDGPEREAAAGDLSLAVLYLENLSRDTADQYLADGLTEDLAASLGRLGRLTVKTPSAVRREQEAHPGNVSEIGRALGVRYVLEGSLRRTSTGLRVAARLVEHGTETQAWSNTYDATPEALLDLPAQLAQDIGDALTGGLLAGEALAAAARPTENPAAYAAFRRGNFYLAQRTREAAEAAHREYQRAVQLDPSFVAALARDAHIYVQQVDYDWLPETASENDLLDRALELIDNALKADSASAEAGTACACALSTLPPMRLLGAREAAERAIALDPSSVEAQNRLGWILLQMGDTQGAAHQGREVLTLDPSSFIGYRLVGNSLSNEGHLTKALAMLDSALLLAPSDYWARGERARVRVLLGDTSGARADAMELEGTSSGAGWLSAYVLARLGNDRIARRMLAGADSVLAPDHEALLWLALDQPRHAIDALEERWRETRSLRYLAWPEMHPLRSDPRFQRVVQQLRDLTIVR